MSGAPTLCAEMTMRRRGYTIIELAAVIVVLAVLSTVAIPYYFDWAEDASRSADEAALGGMRTAMELAHVEHQVNEAPASEYVDSVADIPALMHTGALPDGISVTGGLIEDQRGNLYSLVAETDEAAARLVRVSGGGTS